MTANTETLRALKWSHFWKSRTSKMQSEILS